MAAAYKKSDSGSSTQVAKSFRRKGGAESDERWRFCLDYRKAQNSKTLNAISICNKWQQSSSNLGRNEGVDILGAKLLRNCGRVSARPTSELQNDGCRQQESNKHQTGTSKALRLGGHCKDGWPKALGISLLLKNSKKVADISEGEPAGRRVFFRSSNTHKFNFKMPS